MEVVFQWQHKHTHSHDREKTMRVLYSKEYTGIFYLNNANEERRKKDGSNCPFILTT